MTLSDFYVFVPHFLGNSENFSGVVDAPSFVVGWYSVEDVFHSAALDPVLEVEELDWRLCLYA